MGHAELVFDYQQAMHEGFGFEIQRMVDVIFRRIELVGMAIEDIAKDIPCPYMRNIAPDWPENLFQCRVRNKTLPEQIIFVDIVLKVIVDHRTIISPRIAAKKLVAASAR